MTILTAYSPINGHLLGEYAISSADEIKASVERARCAGQAWQQLSVAKRCQHIAALSPLILSQLDSICEQLCQTTGKVRTEALLGEIYPVLDLLAYYVKHAPKVLQERAVFTSPLSFPASTAHIEFHPYGVVAILAPWNFPFQLAIIPMITALIAGNAVILKASELSLPINALLLELFQQLALPEHLVQTLVGDGSVGEQLIDAGPDLVFFTGGLQTGRAVMQRAAQHPIPVLLELGGKDAMIIFADAQLSRASHAVMYGAFSNSGQICISIERLYIEHHCFDDFLQQLQNELATLTIGHGEYGDVGTITSARQFALVEAHYHDALTKGACASGPLERHGNYVKPVILWNVHTEMRIMQEETFGALVAVLPFNTEAEVIKRVNDCQFGLNASIWSQDLSKATRVAKQLEVGGWVVNDVIKNVGHPQLPFGGVKKSGFGRYHGAEGLRAFSYSVSTMINRSRLAKEPNWFPYSQTQYQHFKGYLDVIYGRGSWLQRVQRNRLALTHFREFSQFNFLQHWQNLKSRLPWHRIF
jgi:acyl-CoA reductase-like NAD-dependent aldehyde dehydrogenase